MSIVAHRSLGSIVKGVWTHMLSIFTMFTFPYQVTVFFHRLRGVKIGNKSHVARGVILDDRNAGFGFKAKDWELIGIPYQIVVGRDAVNGMVEFKV